MTVLREPISKKLRFEVFKRDSFTCQYCGSKAPDVALNADHIKPVIEGGTTDLLNLITACFDCNAGKGRRELADDAALSKQIGQMTALQERRQQLEMMAEWRSGLEKIEETTLLMAEEAWQRTIESASSLTDHGRRELGKLVKRHGLEAVFNGISGACASYLRRNEVGIYSLETIAYAFDMIGRVISVQKKGADKPYLQRLFYARGVLRNRLNYINEQMVMRLMEDAVIAGADPESIIEVAKTVRSWTAFKDSLERFVDIQAADEVSADATGTEI